MKQNIIQNINIVINDYKYNRGLNKINAMPSKENLKLVPHHLFSINELDVKFSVAEWIKLASKIKK